MLKEIRRDYAAMEAMIYGDVPSVDHILEVLKDLEGEINALSLQPTEVDENHALPP